MADASQSERLQSLSKLGLILVAVVLVLTIAGAWFFSSRAVSAIDQDRLENYQQSLHSYASEGLLLAEQYQKDRPLSTYSEVSFRKLFEGTSDVANKLQTEQAEPKLTKPVKKTADRANTLSDILSELSQSPDQSQTKDLVGKLISIKHEFEEAQ